MAELTTMEIAFRTRKSERQVQRWIQSGKLPAQHIQGNVYEVNEDDLTPFLPREVVTDLVERIASLESRVHVLEATIEDMSISAYTPQKHAPRLLREHSGLSESSILPGELVPVSEVLKQLNLSRQRKAIVHHLEQKGLLKRGDWSLNGHAVNLALDEQGIEEVKRRYVRE